MRPTEPAVEDAAGEATLTDVMRAIKATTAQVARIEVWVEQAEGREVRMELCR